MHMHMHMHMHMPRHHRPHLLLNFKKVFQSMVCVVKTNKNGLNFISFSLNFVKFSTGALNFVGIN